MRSQAELGNESLVKTRLHAPCSDSNAAEEAHHDVKDASIDSVARLDPRKWQLAANWQLAGRPARLFASIYVMEWEIAYYSVDLQQAILAFPPGLQARYIHLTQRMIEFGPDLGMPHTRSMGNKLFELRLKSKEGVGRVFFGVFVPRRIVMLHVFIKKSAKTPSKELNLARQRLKEIQRNADA
jgi:phage-related protein